MFKRPFFKLTKPRFRYSILTDKPSVHEISLPEEAIFLLEKEHIRRTELQSYLGKRLITGQLLRLQEKDFISPVTGVVTKLDEYIGYLNKQFYAIHVKVEQDEWASIPEDYRPSMLPGLKNVEIIFGFHPPINHVIVMGVDSDLLVTTNQFCLITRIEDVKKGIEFINKKAKIGKISFVIFPDFVSYIKEKIDCEYYLIKPKYPSSIPQLILKDVLKKFLPAGKKPEDLGIAFISTEAVANMGAFFEKNYVFDKIITFINKDYSAVHIKARVGTPIRHILKELDVEVNEGDRIVIGGPMRGYTIHSLDTPVDYETDAIFVQDAKEIIFSSDTHCINCGECVKVCPVNVPVNMLVRLLENSLFEEAAKEYDLLSCIECGLCSYVCIARIPVFHYIMLGKYELSRMGEENAR